jgi:quercetin dioxygenase-like cupin family protein
MSITRISLAAMAVAAAVIGGAAIAQDVIVRTPLQKQEFPGDVHATHIIQVVVAPGALVPRHSHPGIEMGYVVEGTATLMVEGKPEQAMKAGDSYSVPPGTIHSAKNTGTTPVKLIATFVVEKAKPLASPAP